MSSKKSKIKQRADGLQNLLTGLGVSGKDKRMSSSFVSLYVSDIDVETMYENDLAKKVVDTKPDDMTREGFKVLIDGDDSFDDEIQKELERLDFTTKSNEAMKMARLYGGSLLFLGTEDDLQGLETPLQMNQLKKIKYLRVLDKPYLSSTEFVTDQNDPNFGMPLRYQFHSVSIHHSRVIRFDGKKLPYRTFVSNSRWHESVLKSFYEPLVNYQSSSDNLATVLQDFIIPVAKFKNLSNMIEAGQASVVKERIRQLQTNASMVNAIILDTEEESYERITTNVNGLDKMVDKLKERLLSAADGLPHTILFGAGPTGGLSGDGKSEKRDWYDHVKNEQKTHYLPKVNQFLNYLFAQKDFKLGNKKPGEVDFSVEFNPLWQLTLKELAEIHKTQADADKIYIETGVLDPKEVAVSRFENKYSLETNLDQGVRREFAEVEEEEPEEVQDGLYEGINFKPPKDVADNAKRGLELRKKWGRGGTSVGVARAKQLLNRENLSPSTINRMVQFKRHQKSKEFNKQSDGGPSAGHIAWLLWGGDAGVLRWAPKVKAQMEKAEKASKK